MRNAVKAIILFIAAATLLMGQVSQFTVHTDVSGATFRVDGRDYKSQTVFLWPAGSKHTLELLAQSYDADGIQQYTCSTWADSAGLLIPNGSLVQVVTADSRITSFKGTCTVSGYRVDLYFYGDSVSPLQATPNVCEAPGNPSSNQSRVGLVQVASPLLNGCFWQSTYFYTRGLMTLNAFPYPGWVFTGWSPGAASSTAYLTTFNVTRHLQLTAKFDPARRVQFRTKPSGLQVAVDRDFINTPALSPCPDSQWLPIGPVGMNLTVAGLYGPMCSGDFDFPFGSKHVLAAPSPQTDTAGASWVFDSWQDGNGQNAIYTAPSNTGIDTYVARFVPGLRVIFITKPFGLKISIDGRNTWPSYSFVWGADSKHTISAPLEQTDSSGRRYSFRGWSNNGDATQEYTVPSGQAPVMVATYELLGRAIVSTSTAGLAVLVDDSPCQTPCILDRPVGSTVKLSVPSTVALGEGLRADFTGWNDSTEASRTFTFTSDSVVLSAGYQTAYRLQMSSDPSAAALFHGDPESADGYYPANSQVWVSVETKPGFKFRRWTGDVTGSLNGAFVIMNGPRSALALFDKVPYIAETGVKNAAGDTPDSVVAPGSLIAITGASLVEEFIAGPSSPLAQSIGGIYVMLAGRILPLVSVAPDQILALLPSDLELGDYTLKVVFPAQPSATAKFTVVRNAPGLFRSYDDAGTAFAMASHEDGSTISPSSPARKDEVVSLFGTGFGPFDKQMVDGFAVPAKPQVTLADSVTLLLGDTPVTPIWSGAAPGMVGMTVTRFRLPGSTPAGAKVQVKARVNNRVSNTLDLPVE